MRMKTYIVSNLTEAVEKIKKDLGPKAVILSTKKADFKSSLIHFGKPKLEVTAALDVDANHPAYYQPTIASSVTQAVRNVSQINDEKLAFLKSELDEIKESIRLISQNTKSRSSVMAAKSDLPKQVIETPVRALKSEDKLSQVNIAAKNNAKEDNAIISICSQLLKHRVNPTTVQELADYLLETPVSADESSKDLAIEYLFDRIPDPMNYLAIKGKQNLLCFVGPTGAGKTTSLAKIAAMLISNSKKVGMISMDYFRIGGHEQLEKYAKIMQIESLKVGNTQELKDAVELFSDCDFILLDTSGISSRDKESINILGRILKDSGSSIQKTLVLPVNLQEPDLSHVVSSYESLEPSNIIMTKLDESVSFGSLMNATLSTKLPLSYFTLGQEVPEDIEEATKERILDCILNISGQVEVEQVLAEEAESISMNQVSGEMAAR